MVRGIVWLIAIAAATPALAQTSWSDVRKTVAAQTARSDALYEPWDPEAFIAYDKVRQCLRAEPPTCARNPCAGI